MPIKEYSRESGVETLSSNFKSLWEIWGKHMEIWGKRRQAEADLHIWFKF